MRAQHINITIPIDLKARIDEESKREHIGRSTLIQKAVGLYLELIKTRRIRALLAEGYSEMAGETGKIMKDFRMLDDEALKHVD